MPCSAVTLSLATISGVVAAALLAIAVGTDNWQFIRVDRMAMEKTLVDSGIDPDAFRNDGLYYTRTKGLFRVCYPEDLPQGEELYRSPLETQCRNIDYHLFDDDSAKTFDEEFGDYQQVRLHMARSMVALFLASFFFLVVAFFTGIAGCWRRSPSNVAYTAILMLMACLLAAGAMGLWHGVEYYETEKIRVLPYRLGWDDALEENVKVLYDWSYLLAWVGTGMAGFSFCLFLGASQCMSAEQSVEQTKQMQYMMPVYPQKAQYAGGYGGYGYGYNYPPQYGYNY